MRLLELKRRYYNGSKGPRRGKVVDVVKLAGVTIFKWKVADSRSELNDECD